MVLTVHNPTPHESLPLFKYWERRLLLEADALILHTKDGCTQLLKHIPQLCHKRLHVIPHGVTLHPAINISRSAAHKTAGLDQNHRYFVTFGNLRGYKGIPVLLRAWREIMDQFPDTYLVIAGRLWDGKQGLASITGRLLGARKAGAEIQNLLAQPELASRVIFKEGFIAEKIINALCEIAVLAVFPHERMAGQSGAVTRAAGYGVPVLVSNVGGLPTSAMGPRFIVPADDETALAERLSELLREDLQALRALQIKHVSRFEWGRIAALHAKLYQKLAVTTP
ncbi:MAG: glycosyltransferase family 4 protein [bacterium]|nr:glycosyltransferase family 4 protein [bacterium]